MVNTNLYDTHIVFIAHVDVRDLHLQVFDDLSDKLFHKGVLLFQCRIFCYNQTQSDFMICFMIYKTNTCLLCVRFGGKMFFSLKNQPLNKHILTFKGPINIHVHLILYEIIVPQTN